MDVTQPLLRAAQGGARTRLLVDDRVVVVDAHAGTEPVARANPAFGDGPANLGARREQPHTLPLSPPATLFGRERELERLADALDAGDTAVVSGAPGLGKTALLHHLGLTRGENHPDGAVLLSGRGRTVEDLLFEVFRAFYEVPGRRPGPDDLRRHLTAIKALIMIDDVADPVRLARALADAAPYSRVALATEAEQVGRDAFTELVAGIEARDTLVAGVAFGDLLAVDDEDEFEDDDDDDEVDASALIAEHDGDGDADAEIDVEDDADESDDDAEAHAGTLHDEDDDDEDEDDEAELSAEVDAEAEALDEDADTELTADVDGEADDDAEDESEDEVEALVGALDAEGDEADEADDEPAAEAVALGGSEADGELADDDLSDDSSDDDSSDGDDEPVAAVEGTTGTESTKPAKGSGDDD
jgi:hypothetical protein